ncbi:hypothetical protein [Pseudomonas lopnurensis]|uniref:hypothetical protein n=1 Tax=Pseudomonas lopnurensis TaxID=1477517 RepID=UPI0028A8ED46|nr:hypothetical protein [Pseudomonas lopnurensis]
MAMKFHIKHENSSSFSALNPCFYWLRGASWQKLEKTPEGLIDVPAGRALAAWRAEHSDGAVVRLACNLQFLSATEDGNRLVDDSPGQPRLLHGAPFREPFTSLGSLASGERHAAEESRAIPAI